MFPKKDMIFKKKNLTVELNDVTNVIYYVHINESYKVGQTWRHMQTQKRVPSDI